MSISFYRQSMDIYSSVQSPGLSGFLGTPSLGRLSGSFLVSSFRGKPVPEIVKPLLPTAVAVDDDHEDARKSSHQYLPPPRKVSSLFKIPEDQKPLGGVGHEVGPYRQCSYTQGGHERYVCVCVCVCGGNWSRSQMQFLKLK
jgi:vesicular inhibitory amino acid transporter